MFSSREESISGAKDLKSRQKRTYTFDAKKSNTIFNWLLSNKKINLVGSHKVRTADEVNTSGKNLICHLKTDAVFTKISSENQLKNGKES